MRQIMSVFGKKHNDKNLNNPYKYVGKNPRSSKKAAGLFDYVRETTKEDLDEIADAIGVPREEFHARRAESEAAERERKAAAQGKLRET
ncbi:hypothetical protein LRS73_18085 [Methylobacterium currus]|uniref:hypothetical protein n=1 Tax=Methylobacterium currus TaxID=2051553 RepID=UPI001E495C16|nr:hypothetical protein [Methylobacterium currus]UHC14458.1 hypothetical protein LRS73_18085 [Methylobacterium currus]